MDLENILAVGGLNGLHKLVTTRSNGLIIEDFDSGKRSFISLRKRQFTPLESVGIYTYSDVVDLKEIFAAIKTQNISVPEIGAGSEEIHAFFRKVLPEYDEERVYLTDIKKVIKWYGFLEERKLLEAGEEEE